MASAAGAEAYFQRGSLIWFAVIILSFGYYTVKARRGVSAPFSAGRAPAREDRPRQAPSRRPRARDRGRGDETQEEDSGTLVGPRLSPEPATQAFPVWGRGGAGAPHPTIQCLDLSRWWRSRRPARLLPPTSVQPDPCPLWSPSWGWDTSR